MARLRAWPILHDDPRTASPPLVDFETGDLFVRWTVRAAVACWALRVLIDADRWRRTPAEPDRPRSVARIGWTAGAVLMLVHVLFAFGVYHGWSHAAALAHTAERTHALVGWRSGAGLWFNHVVTVWWLADTALWWWRGLDFPDRVPVYTRCLHVFFAFMMVNATVVFGPGFWWWPAAAFGVILAVCLLRR